MTVEISLCVCTYRRPQLASTLASLERQQLPDGVSLALVIIDNDAAGSARPIVEAFQRHSKLPVKYHIESRKSLSHARNASLRLATGEWLAFIDDDEQAQPDWLCQLLTCTETYQADGAIGTVKALYPPKTPAWIREGGFFDKPGLPTGTKLNTGSTCNALLRRSLVTGDEPFDPRYGATGGEDTDFFARLVRQGATLVACREALVLEHISPDRVNSEFLIRRAIRMGESYSQIFWGGSSLPGRAGCLLRASIQTMVAGMIAVLFLPGGKAASFTYVLKMMLNWGKVRHLTQWRRMELYK